ncbi:hypothetical protein [Janibacter alittae]|uniref:DUF4190 domain-containing protein n=1 Tax=Janibacter alittae TaxID=3115209 RepID=A0ABZ2MLX1_9MICO
MKNALLTEIYAVPMEVCPVAPPGAQAHADQLMGYVLWGVGILFVVGIIIGVGAVVGGRIFGMSHASKGGIISLVVVFIAIILYLVLPEIVESMTGSGCI